MPDASRIAIASASLDGYAAYKWSQKPEPEKALLLTWEGYMQWCRTLVADPVNTLADSTLRIKECQQRADQSARDVQRYIESHEAHIPRDMPMEQRRAYQLLNSLRPATRTHILQ